MPDGKPNILVIWGDDIGITNLSCYSDGLMGYRTPNIDRISDEGIRFTDSYGEQSCTAGRSAFITGQSGAWLRRVLRQPLPLERRGGS
jgi:arylsulfatase